MRIRCWGALALVVGVAAVAYAQKVHVDSNPSAPFATYKTYTWTPGAPAFESLVEQRIHAGVNARLQAKGLTPADGHPSLYVASFVLTKAEPQLIADGFGLWGFGGGFATVDTLVKGTLVVDLYDANTKKMVWRGVATATVSDKPSKNASKIDKALESMFEKYPPTGITSR